MMAAQSEAKCHGNDDDRVYERLAILFINV